MSETNEKASYLWRLGRWMAELVLVFVGVYAAFWLNNYQQHLQEAKRRDQILSYLEQRLQDGIDSVKRDGAQEEKQVAEFQRALAAGEMPPLRPFAFFTDYNPADIATLLQSGGIELLDIKTLTVLREMETDVRTDLSTLAHFEKLGDEMIAPNLDQDISFFLRSGDEETAEAVREISRWFTSYGETFSRYGTDSNGLAQTGPG